MRGPKRYVTCACTDAMRSCSLVCPPEKSVLSVKSHTPAIASTIQLPAARDHPISGFTDQRFEPRLITLVLSYCPSGGATVTLAPTIVRIRYDARSVVV